MDMASGNRLCKTLLASQKNYYAHLDKSYSFPTKGSKGLLLEREENFLLSILNNKRDLNESILGLERSSYAYMMYVYYALYILEDKVLAQKNLNLVNAYSILCVEVFVSSKMSIAWIPTAQEKMVFSLAFTLLYEAKNLASDYIALIKDMKLDPPLWFIVSLYQKYIKADDSDTSQDKYLLYSKILASWDSEELRKIDYYGTN